MVAGCGLMVNCVGSRVNSVGSKVNGVGSRKNLCGATATSRSTAPANMAHTRQSLPNRGLFVQTKIETPFAFRPTLRQLLLRHKPLHLYFPAKVLAYFFDIRMGCPREKKSEVEGENERESIELHLDGAERERALERDIEIASEKRARESAHTAPQRSASSYTHLERERYIYIRK